MSRFSWRHCMAKRGLKICEI